ncbi:MAG: hypothetical protein V2A56_01350 [bacterium]
MDGIGPFPLHPDAKRLKPQFAKLVAPVFAVILFIMQGPLKNIDYQKYISSPLDWPMLVAMGVIALMILYILGELVLKKIYYSPSGIGIARSGSTPIWYPFDELREVKVSRAARNMKSRQRRSSRIRLVFQTGKISISGGLYSSTQVQELVEIVETRTPRAIKTEYNSQFALKRDGTPRNPTLS